MNLLAGVSRRGLGMSSSAAVLFCCAASVCAQATGAQEKPPIQVPAAPASGAQAGEEVQSCPLLVGDAVPTRSTLAVKLNMLTESNHLKPGKHLWGNSIYETELSGCHIASGAPIYADVTAATGSKNHGPSTLALAFNSVDCLGHTKQPMRFLIIGAYAPPDEPSRTHDAVPTEVQGGVRQISSTAMSTDGYDAELGAAFPGGVRPGTAAGMNHISLLPQGGPGCSSEFTATDRNVVLAPGTILLLVAPTR